MKYRTIGFILTIIALQFSSLTAQPVKILHFTKTSGFDHQTRVASFAMFEQMGLQHGFTVDDDNTGAAFNSLATLLQYDVVVFSNTSGNAILDSAQQQHFMQYMDSNGGFVGIHAASDTYRHSSANGTDTGNWDWYAEMIGASVQANPHHVNGIPVYRIDALFSHQLLSGVPDPWFKAEEYYYWEAGYFNSANVILQKVEETIGPNGMVNSYDSSRAVTWHRFIPGGGRVFYTSLGHDVSNYTIDMNFYTLLENAVLWAGNTSSSLNFISDLPFLQVHPNPCGEKVFISHSISSHHYELTLFNIHGKRVGAWRMAPELLELDIRFILPGVYFLNAGNDEKSIWVKLIKK